MTPYQSRLGNTCIWHARVYPDGEQPAENYYFWNERDALDTVLTTWSKCMHKITIDRVGFSVSVKSNDLLKTELVRIDRITLGGLIQDKPTHF